MIGRLLLLVGVGIGFLLLTPDLAAANPCGRLTYHSAAEPDPSAKPRPGCDKAATGGSAVAGGAAGLGAGVTAYVRYHRGRPEVRIGGRPGRDGRTTSTQPPQPPPFEVAKHDPDYLWVPAPKSLGGWQRLRWNLGNMLNIVRIIAEKLKAGGG